jgi:hypothetical protein
MYGEVEWPFNLDCLVAPHPHWPCNLSLTLFGFLPLNHLRVFVACCCVWIVLIDWVVLISRRSAPKRFQYGWTFCQLLLVGLRFQCVSWVLVKQSSYRAFVSVVLFCPSGAEAAQHIHICCCVDDHGLKIVVRKCRKVILLCADLSGNVAFGHK